MDSLAKATYFFTGFPGFLATRIIDKLIENGSDSDFELLVHPSAMEQAKIRTKRLAGNGRKIGRIRIHEGDITKADLGLASAVSGELNETVTHVFHLAAVYDLAVPEALAQAVNVTGTRNVNAWVLHCRKIERYVYFSTAYVSGTRKGTILETELACGQGFKNHYERTKYDAEVLVHYVRDRVPTTIIRPGIVLGDSRTGETEKFDGPYFIMRFLDKFSGMPIPYIGKSRAAINLVPVDYIIDATHHLSRSSAGIDKVYHLTDPSPYMARDAFRLIAEELAGKKPVFTVPRSSVYMMLSMPSFRRWVQVERETLDYFHLEAEFDCSGAAADLSQAGIRCPDFADYIPKAVEFYKENRHDPRKLIEVK
ncbi:SDR family oxidoreductase [Edaphobacillus lindanitolerans]|uniref:Thioester reductase domain-containing protein n=1 Tax=Edaphobacillus lindanitolerans TaxID=550447 RepID=A0A1U7PQ27_9BACI|nr:SDR family oxidoreductase [Edaphobacillus lindanitolerans]SIT84290.1 Thioester reductase domain-containing protein [Edaphobacillus lindanitolerans]